MKNTFIGKNYSVKTFENQFILMHPVSENETYDSFEELVESHPFCEESREYFFGESNKERTMTTQEALKVIDECGQLTEHAQDRWTGSSRELQYEYAEIAIRDGVDAAIAAINEDALPEEEDN